jgi:hypothetical protein
MREGCQQAVDLGGGHGDEVAYVVAAMVIMPQACPGKLSTAAGAPFELRRPEGRQARAWTVWRAGTRRRSGGPGSGPGRSRSWRPGSIPQSATSDARITEIVSGVVPGSRPILSVGALLQAATVVRRLLSAAGEPDAAECRACGYSRSCGLGSPAGGTAGCGGGAAGDAGSESGPRGGRRS